MGYSDWAKSWLCPTCRANWPYKGDYRKCPNDDTLCTMHGNEPDMDEDAADVVLQQGLARRASVKAHADFEAYYTKRQQTELERQAAEIRALPEVTQPA